MKRAFLLRLGIVGIMACGIVLGLVFPAPAFATTDSVIALPTGTLNPEILQTLSPTQEFPDLPQEDYWRLEVDLHTPAEEITELEQALGAIESSNPVQTGITTHQNASGEEVTTITLEGYSVPLLQQVMFVGLKPIVDVLGNQISLSISGNVQKGDQIKLDLPGIPSSGYGWQLWDVLDFFIQIINQLSCYISAPGLPGTQSVTYEALQSGDVILKLAYQRFWEVFEPTVRIYLKMGAIPDYFDLSMPNIPEISLFEPQTGDLGPVEDQLGEGDLPSSFNWADSNNTAGASMMTSVKDQGSCGSCWSFSTVGVMEAVIKINGGPDTNLAEQYLVSCNSDDWSCNGGLWAHDYHIAKQGNENNQPGAVLESDFPYEAANGTCKLVQNHPYKLGAWYYVGDDSLDSVPAIKSAIYNYGPVSSAVYVGTAFQSYSGGVFETNECGQPNHAIIITGWDDSTESWVIKNSWGSGWGENGYMRIKWGTSAIGYNANYVVYGGSGTTSSTTSGDTTATPLTSGGEATPVAYSAVPSGTVQDTDSRLMFSGTWNIYSGSEPSGESTHYSNVKGNSLNFTFVGNQFAVGYTGHPSHGLVLVLIDGSQQLAFNQFAWDLQWQKEWLSPELENGQHSVILQHATGSEIDIDYIKSIAP